MLDCIVSGRESARTAWATLSPPVTLYTNQRDENATVPHGYIWAESEVLGAARGWGEDVVHLDIWGRSQGEIQDLENKVAFLDDYSGASTGNAIAPRWFVQSKTRFQEEDGTFHTAILYMVRYGDRRKLLSA